MSGIWLSKRVKEVINDYADAHDCCVIEFLEHQLQLEPVKLKRRFNDSVAGLVSLPKHIREHILELALERDCSANRVLEDALDVEPYEHPPSKYDVSDLAVGESKYFEGVSVSGLRIYVRDYRLKSGRKFDIYDQSQEKGKNILKVFRWA